jgi:hypothetical protein
LRDFEKLSAILDAAQEQYPTAPLPRAFVGAFDNQDKRRFNFHTLQRRLDAVSLRPDVTLLPFDVRADL